MERWRGNLSDADLFLGRCGDIAPEKLQDTSHTAVILKRRCGRLSRNILYESGHCNPNRAKQ